MVHTPTYTYTKLTENLDLQCLHTTSAFPYKMRIMSTQILQFKFVFPKHYSDSN